ncbi:hypothetical protein FOA52_008615 [Chlamydomonas sp. UWO 241]|nr:hypothetical protein FOA52_008615 [Chlamydomonas sp. UWO 241]
MVLAGELAKHLTKALPAPVLSIDIFWVSRDDVAITADIVTALQTEHCLQGAAFKVYKTACETAFMAVPGFVARMRATASSHVKPRATEPWGSVYEEAGELNLALSKDEVEKAFGSEYEVSGDHEEEESDGEGGTAGGGKGGKAAATRLAHWGVCAGESEAMACDKVLDHPFFKDNTEMGDGVPLYLRQKMADIHSAVLRVGDKVDVVDGKLDVVLQRLQAHTRMLSSILTQDRAVPSLMFFLPGGAGYKGRARWTLAMRPSEWLQQEVRVFFVDPVSMEWDEKSGLTLIFTKEWVMDAMPYIKVGLVALKIAAAAGRLAGFPIPDFVDNIGQIVDEQEGALGMLVESLGAAAAAELKAIEAVISAVSDGTAEVAPDVTAAARGPLKQSCAADGLCEWVLPKHAEQFKLLGGKMLGMQSAQQVPDPGAVLRTVQEVHEAYEAQLAAELKEHEQILAGLAAGGGSSSSRAARSRAPAAAAAGEEEEEVEQPGGCGLMCVPSNRQPRSKRVAPAPPAAPRK